MRQFRQILAATALATAALSHPASAQAAKPPTPPPAQPPAPAANPAVPQSTTASFADWTLRCTRTTPTVQTCEVVQTITNQERTVAQLAIGRVAKGQPMHLTILVPASVSFATVPALTTARDGDGPVVGLAWRRCMPGGCLAEGTIADEVLRRMRTWTDPARVTFSDGTGRVVALPFSPQGLPPALDGLAKEDPG